MKKETIDEFLARGGVINKIPATPVEEPSQQSVRVNGTPENRILSLDDGEFYFAESRKNKKQPKKVLLTDVVDKFNLPPDIVARLRGNNE